MKIVSGIDLDRKRLTMNITSDIFIDFYPNFAGLIKEDPTLPSDIEAVRHDSNIVTVSFPLPDSISTDPTEEEMQAGFKKIAIPPDTFSPVLEFLSKFTAKALKILTKTREFLPLHGYPEDRLTADSEAALRNKRDLVIIDEYQSYLDNMKNGQFNYNQYILKYSENKSEYCDAILLLQGKKYKEFRKKYKSKLQSSSWM